MRCDEEFATKPPDTEEHGRPKDEVFVTEEVEIEEMAIDGICGVY
jgi:mycofactocin precursor